MLKMVFLASSGAPPEPVDGTDRNHRSSRLQLWPIRVCQNCKAAGLVYTITSWPAHGPVLV